MRKILLVDLFTWNGHHAPYFVKILTILVQHGYFVYATCAENSALRKAISEGALGNCAVVDLKLTLFDRLQFKIYQLLDEIIKRLPINSHVRFLTLFHLIGTRRLLSQINENLLVFFVDVDSVVPAVPGWLARIYFPADWVGLSILPSYKSKQAWSRSQALQRFYAERNLALPSCRCLLVLHPIYIQFFAIRFGNLRCIHLPELVDINIRSDSELVSRILSIADGRTIVSLFGVLIPNKNLLLLLEAFLHLDQQQYFCLIIGKLPDALYTKDKLERITLLSHQLAACSFIKLDYQVPSEEELNALINISDVVFLHYKNHPFSSNFLAKAMAFGKPAIVNHSEIMERMIEAYDWRDLSEAEPWKVAQSIERARLFQPTMEAHSKFLQDHAIEKFSKSIIRACGAASI